MYFADSAKRRLNQTPQIKRVLKFLLKWYLRKRDRHDGVAMAKWMATCVLSAEEMTKQRMASSLFQYKPLISIIVPMYNTPRDFFDQMLDSVRQQTYDNWELILVDDASSDQQVRKNINEAVDTDARIKKVFLSRNHHISGATNEGIKASSGEFVSLFDHDDLLHPGALYEIVSALNRDRAIDFIYTDEVKVDETGAHYSDLFLKPDWNPEMLHSINYITHFTTIRRALLDEKGLLDKNYDGAQDWELFLRLTRDLPEEKILHISKTLYSWRVHEASTAGSLEAKPYVITAQKRAIEDNLKALGYRNFIVKQDEMYSAQWQVDFSLHRQPLVSIVIMGNKSTKLEKYIQANTAYKKYEIAYIQQGQLYKDIEAIINGDFVIFLGNKIKIHVSDWVERFLGDAQRADVGFVISRYRSDQEIEKNVLSLLPPPEALFVNGTSHRALSRHFYTTTRYNVDRLGEGTVAIEARKLMKVAQDNPNLNIIELGSSMRSYGYRNLYNPAIKMIK